MYVTARVFLVLGSRVKRLADELRAAEIFEKLASGSKGYAAVMNILLITIIGAAGILLGLLQVILPTIEVLQGSRISS